MTQPPFLARAGKVIGLTIGADTDRAAKEIRSAVPLSAGDLWLLASSALLASLGLDQDSAAVIIGAMLVSPLMNPILAVGLALGISDAELLRRALRTLGLAVVISLGLSVLYFLLSPLAQVTPQLEARTRPTLLDVGVAFFGGLAGMVAGTRRMPSSAIPGVAIATALMPPLCTAGFGIATGHWQYALGAFYLFFLNAVFISLATYLVVRLLHTPLVGRLDPTVARRSHLWIAGVALVAAVPGAVMLYFVVRGVRQQQAIATVTAQAFPTEDRRVLRWEMQGTGAERSLDLFVAGAPMTPEATDSVAARLRQAGLTDIQLHVIETGLPATERQRVTSEATVSAIRAAEAAVARGRAEDSARLAQRIAAQRGIGAELAALAPEVRGLELGEARVLLGEEGGRRVLAAVTVDRTVPARTRAALEERIGAFLAARLGVDSAIVLIRTPPAP